ncbi:MULTISPECIES: DUF2167 domain-containing protein [unclassified Lysobacter]|uniref:DUF2167 domain-containing protein n=1 Tax=unclassified Lysobacter TaxID=2635362 RepID=UPI001BE8237C|nr:MULTISPECIES: DUF2167 domain-containing protein [unclassified Lysobacter]MBT2749030.1 DUF2167 domain-containing protein [Lysobacter sp. ISL-42]MBT2750363.1 DUF2167 domain-containing protein [Lysobacter sp. ISL-50]MBT2778461.1 DUF2167 domain-containing protein [Lysobacter sp. ISL-54]MBT2781077.1 DUF2167 domain-containing protein [Lysobacter sp. ISL-52]
MRKRLLSVLTALALVAAAAPAAAQDSGADAVANLAWKVGPTQGSIAEKASIKVPDGYAFLDAAGTRKLNELLHNPPTGTDEYTLAPKDLKWFSFFHYNDIGYVKDEESLDPDGILDSIREGTEEGNVERRKRGWETMKIEGWSFKPQYDKSTHNLEWAVLASTSGSADKIVNYNTRLLGRHGVTEVILVADQAGLNQAIGQFKQLVPGYTFNDGEKYSEFKPGDHVAEFGLAALITGGAAAVATKKGFFAAIGIFLLKAWKLVLVGLAAAGGVIAKLFGRKKDADRE